MYHYLFQKYNFLNFLKFFFFEQNLNFNIIMNKKYLTIINMEYFINFVFC